MSDASQGATEASIAENLASAIDGMLETWPPDQDTAKVTLDMTRSQWDELLGILRLHQADADLRSAAER